MSDALNRSSMVADHEQEIAAGERFSFGKNWQAFLAKVNEQRIEIAIKSLQSLIGRDDLAGTRFVDVGSGSGLFSLAARRLGAEVLSFDFDPRSVACTEELRHRFQPDDPGWTVCTGSVLDSEFLTSLGHWDIVYSWGVLHHTGEMWQALENIHSLVDKRGLLVLALYNDQGRASRRWLRIKQYYNRLPKALRWLIFGPALIRLWGPTIIRDGLGGRPLATWSSYTENSARGMSPWFDLIDWVGGLPFEVAKPEELLKFYRGCDFELLNLNTCAGGIGCNEFVFGSKGSLIET